jgi:flagellar assembly factor FliW
MAMAVRAETVERGMRLDAVTIEFRAGLVGLPDLRRFVLVERGPTPWWWLQSLDVPAIALAVIDPHRVDPGYAPALPQEALDAIGAVTAAEVALLCVAIPHADGSATVNLLAPLVIAVAQRRAVQVVLEPGSYPLRHLYRPGR